MHPAARRVRDGARAARKRAAPRHCCLAHTCVLSRPARSPLAHAAWCAGSHEHYPRPFCAVSLCAEAPILFGTASPGPNAIVPSGTGDFKAPFSLPLPVGSVIVFQGNGGTLAQHCVPGVPAYRISITFRKIPADVKRELAQLASQRERLAAERRQQAYERDEWAM